METGSATVKYADGRVVDPATTAVTHRMDIEMDEIRSKLDEVLRFVKKVLEVVDQPYSPATPAPVASTVQKPQVATQKPPVAARPPLAPTAPKVVTKAPQRKS